MLGIAPLLFCTFHARCFMIVNGLKAQQASKRWQWILRHGQWYYMLVRPSYWSPHNRIISFVRSQPQQWRTPNDREGWRSITKWRRISRRLQGKYCRAERKLLTVGSGLNWPLQLRPVLADSDVAAISSFLQIYPLEVVKCGVWHVEWVHNVLVLTVPLCFAA